MASEPRDAPDIRELYDRLADEGTVEADDLSATVERAEALADRDDDPWYLHALSSGGAWLSALFLGLMLVGLAKLLGLPDALVEHWLTWMVLGAASLGTAIQLDDAFGDHLFVSHFAGAMGVGGLGSVLGGLVLFGHTLFDDYLDLAADDLWIGLWIAPLAAICLVGAIRLHRARGHRRFDAQLVFAAAIAAQGLALVAGNVLIEAYASGTLDFPVLATLLVEGLVAAVLYVYYDSDFHRFLSALAVHLLAVAAIFDVAGGWHGLEPAGAVALAALFALETAIVALVFSPGRWLSLSTRLALRPLGFASALVVVGLASELFLLEVAEVGALWPYRGALAAALIALTYGTVDASDSPDLEPALWGAGATVLLAVVSTPGVLASLMLLFIGLWRQRGSFLALGTIALGFHLIVFYYLMEITLFDKSLMLMATGAILLALREWFRRRPWYATEGAA